jgi:Flavinator of succinate dehydrogenase
VTCLTDSTSSPGPLGADCEMGRLRWRCRRGMRELDEVLTRFLQEGLPAAGRAERAAFEELLTLSDPQLIMSIGPGRWRYSGWCRLRIMLNFHKDSQSILLAVPRPSSR